MRVGLKYCGSCNPRIDLGPIGRRVRERAGAVHFVPLAGGKADLVLILNACQTACADRPDVRAQAREAIVVAGESVESEPVPEGQIAEQVAKMVLIKATS